MVLYCRPCNGVIELIISLIRVRTENTADVIIAPIVISVYRNLGNFHVKIFMRSIFN